VYNVRYVLHVVVSQDDSMRENNMQRRVAVKTPPSGVGKVRDTVTTQIDGRPFELRAYEWPRFQLSHLVMGQRDVLQRRQICRFVENARLDGQDDVVA